MKKLFFTALVGFAMVAVTGCTTSSDTDTGAKCSASGKCASSKQTMKMKCSQGKCG